MAINYINTGSSANKGDGDSIRSAFTKVNANFAHLTELIGTTATDFAEIAQDAVADAFLHSDHSGLTVDYNDTDNKVVLTVLPQNNQILDTDSSVTFESVSANTGTFSTINVDNLNVSSIGINGELDDSQEIFNINTSAGTNAKSVYVAQNNVDGRLRVGINGSNSVEGNILENEAFIYSVDAGNTLHIGNTSSLALYANAFVGHAGTATVFIDRQTQNVTFLGSLRPYFDKIQNLGTPTKSWGTLFSQKVQFNSAPELVSQYGSIEWNASTGTGINVVSRNLPLKLTASENLVGTSDWTFKSDGTIEFPDGTIQSTAWTGSGGGSSFDQDLNTYDSVRFLNLTSTGTLYQGTIQGDSDLQGTTIRIDADQPNYTQVAIKNYNSSTTSTSDIMIFHDAGTSDTGYIDLGINSTNYIESAYGLHTPGSGYLFAKDADLVIGSMGTGKKVVIHAGTVEASSAAIELDLDLMQINRSVRTEVSIAGTLKFEVQNTKSDLAAKSEFRAVNDLNDHLKMGINSGHMMASYGTIGNRSAYIHVEGSTASLHIGDVGDIVFWSDEPNLGYHGVGPATLHMSRIDRTSTFGGHVLPAADLMYDLGSSSTQWRSLHVGTGTIYIGGVPITVNQTNNTLIVGATPGTEPTTATNLATESYVIDYVNQFGGAGLEIDGGNASTIYTAEIEIDGGEA